MSEDDGYNSYKKSDQGYLFFINFITFLISTTFFKVLIIITLKTENWT